MNKGPIFLLLFFISFSSFGQILDPVDWTFSGKHIDESTVELSFDAKMEPKWSIYSQFIDEGGPVPTSIYFDESPNFELLGPAEEHSDHVKSGPDELFDGIVVTKFQDEANFLQKVKIVQFPATIKGEVEYMTCDNERCLPPTTEPFEFTITKDDVVVGSANATPTDEGAVAIGTADKGANQELYGLSPADLKMADAPCNSANAQEVEAQKESNLWQIFGLGFIGGLLALLTPCVFPMIPLTVSFFTKQNSGGKSKGIFNAVMYGFFILAVYLLLSVPFHLLDSVNPDILNEISTNVWLNLFFFFIFIFFALSFFGYYELTLPSSWTSTTTKNESVGGLVGIFFMALTLALVSFSCTGPILGSLLAGSLSSDGGAWQLTAGMGGFGLALGLPFALFALFPNMLNSLPKSGGWLNTVKVVLGFLELALAFKFLSNADLVKHWGLLKIEPFLVIWIIIFAGLALYLFGKIKFPHDSPIKKLSPIRIGLAFIVALFTVYLMTGFRLNPKTKSYYPLKALSGLAPPVGYSIFHPKDCPNNLDCFKDLKEGLAYAQEVNKPVMLDFTGYACVNCRKMEEHVWTNKEVGKLLNDDFVVISLYVDNKKDLPMSEQVDVDRLGGGTRKLVNYGQKWANFQTQFFETNSQPYYVLLSPDGQTVLNTPVGYTPEVDNYLQFLNCGLTALNTVQQ